MRRSFKYKAKNKVKLRILLIVCLSFIGSWINAQIWTGTSFIYKTSKVNYVLRLEERMNQGWDQNSVLTSFQTSFQTKIKPIVGVGYWYHEDKGQEPRLFQGLEYKGMRGMIEERFFETDFKVRARIRLLLKQELTDKTSLVASNELFFWNDWEHDRFQVFFQHNVGKVMLNWGYMYYYTNKGVAYDIALISIVWNI